MFDSDDEDEIHFNGLVIVGTRVVAYEGFDDEIEIPEEVTEIESKVFAGLSITKVTFKGVVTKIGDVAFSKCKNLTQIELPEGLEEIGYGAFNGSGLTSIKLPGTITSLGKHAFHGCESLESVEIGEGITSISEGCFQGCSSLTSFKNATTCVSTGMGAFRDCPING